MTQLMDFHQQQSIEQILKASEVLLRPRLYRILNPNVINTELRISVHFKDGLLTHMKEYESEPSYVADLPAAQPDESYVRSVLLSALHTLKMRLEARLNPGWYGHVALSIAISNGEATITSETDGVYKP
jgi:hypothetical protein